MSKAAGKGQTRAVYGLVTGLPFSGAFRVVFTFSKAVSAFCPALVGGLRRLGGLPKAMVSDNDACIVASRRGGQVRLVDEVAALYGTLGLKPVVLRPAFPQGKGFIERMNRYLETSFLPLRTFDGLQDLQAQGDTWTTTVADGRHVRRLEAAVADALAVERSAMRALPARPVLTDLVGPDQSRTLGPVLVDTASLINGAAQGVCIAACGLVGRASRPRSASRRG